MVDDKHRYPARLEVLYTRWLTRNMARVVVGGPGFDDYAPRHNDFTDRYVKLVFLDPTVDYGEPLDLVRIKADLPGAAQPVLRTYTLQHVDFEAKEIAIDFVVHGDSGFAGPWARDAKPGDVIHLRGPGGAYSPDPDADAHLLVGDETALPAIAAALAALPADTPATIFIEVDGPDDEINIDIGTAHRLQWLHRRTQPRGTTTLLADAVMSMPWPEGRVQAFVHGEAGLMKALRSYLLGDRGVARRDLSISGYWRAGNTEELFRQWKRQQESL